MMTKTNLMFNVWIGNLNKYNCGELFGEWIDFLTLDIDATFSQISPTNSKIILMTSWRRPTISALITGT